MLNPVSNGVNLYAPQKIELQTPRNAPEEAPKKSASLSLVGGSIRPMNGEGAIRRAIESQLRAADPTRNLTPVPLPGATFGTVALAAAETYGTQFPANSSFVKVNSIGNQTNLDHVMTAITDRMQDVIDKNKRPSYNISIPMADGSKPTGTQLAPSESESTKAEQQGLHSIARYNPASGELILAYRGTVPVHPANLIQDAKLAVLYPPKDILDTSTQFAKDTIDQLKAQGNPVNKVITTGHSLGGYIAEYVAANLPHDDATKVVELAFDAPGLPKSEWQKTLNMNAANVSAPGDLVHLAGGRPVGKAITMGEEPSGPLILQPLVQHMISQILTPLTKQPALANLGISQVSGQSKESLDALASVSADEYKNMSIQERKTLAEGDPKKILSLLDERRSPVAAVA